MTLKLIMLPVIGAIIGWVTNWIAIVLLFRPYEPIKIPLLPIEIIGLIPKRHREIAQKVGEVVEKELLSVEDLWVDLQKGTIRDQVVQAIVLQVERRFGDKIPFFLQGMKGPLMMGLQDILSKEINLFFEHRMDELLTQIKANISISAIVEEKINALSLREVEKLVVEVANKELKHIEILGGVLGFIIGLLQVLVVVLF